MKRCDTFLTTLITPNPNPLTPVLVRHRSKHNILINPLNHELLIVFSQNCFFTQRTAVLPRLQKGRKAGTVESVTAGQELNGITGGMKGFQADSTVRGGRIERAAMGRKSESLYADSALVTVRMVLGTADPTDSTGSAVELPLVLIVQQNTDRTPVFPEYYVASLTDLGSVLDQIASHTLHGLDQVPIHDMCLLKVLLLLIENLGMTEPTAHVLATAGRQQHPFPSVVGTS